jgi:hypothetical protein
MVRWKAFAAAAPSIAETGRRHLYRPDQGEVGLLATVDARGNPRIAPVCPIFTVDGVFLSIAAHTPKWGHLEQHGGYALHAQVGAEDEEFQISGKARRVTDARELQSVIAAIPFPSHNENDPVFELLIAHALAVTWPTANEPNKRAWTATL